MARSELVRLPSDGSWVELTDGEDAGGIVSPHNRGPYAVTVLVTTDPTRPSEATDEGWTYNHGEADARTLVDMFPGLATPVRLWGRSFGATVMVSYA